MSGGKVPRGRRRAPLALPYLRPEEEGLPSPPPPSSQSENPTWFSGLISGAGRLISSMFQSNNEEEDESSCSCSSDVDENADDSFDEDDDASSDEFHELDESGENSTTCVRHGGRPESTTQRSERNLIIEQLLRQETFSRDECDKLIKIIQAQVVDTVDGGKTAVVKELPCSTVCGVIAFSAASRSPNPERRFPAGQTYVADHLNDCSPRSIVSGAHSPELCEKAGMEAKKWVEKKRSASTPNSELDCGPCVLNTDALHYFTEDEFGSPVDMAKSYMQAQFPWQSPTLSSPGFKSTSPLGMHHFQDETPYANAHSFSTSKGLEESAPMKEQVNDVSLHDESASSKPSMLIHNDAIYLDEELLDAEPDALGSESIQSLLLRDPGAAKMRQDCQCQLSSLELSQFEERHSPLDSSLLDRQNRKKAAPVGGYAAHGDFSFQSGSIKRADHHFAKSSNGGSAAAMSVETCSVLMDSWIDVSVGHTTSGALKEAENGTTTKSIKQMLADSSDSRRGRGRKIVAKCRGQYANFSFQQSSLKKDDYCFPKSSGHSSAVSIPVKSCQLSIVPVDRATSDILNQTKNVASMKSTKHMLAENLPNSTCGRGRKVAARYKKGRGRGK